MPIRIVVAEDSSLVRAGVVRLGDGEDDIEVVAACGDIDAVLGAVS